MQNVAIACFALAACAGAFMGFRILTGKSVPYAAAGAHGVAGATGLALLLLAVLSAGSFGYPGLALSVLGANALVGFGLFSFHVRGKPWPKWLVLVHGSAAVGGFSLLVAATLGWLAP